MADDDIAEALEAQKADIEVVPRSFFQNLAVDCLAKYMEKLPPSLFHYTSSLGMIGVATKHQLWFSDSRFLNDGSETKYGIDIAIHCMNMLKGKYEDIGVSNLNRLADAIEEVANHYRNVVFCMSAQDNLLNQWRDYGKDVVPYCIEFETAKLVDRETYNFQVILSPIEYNQDRQIEMMLHMLEFIYEEAKKLADDKRLETEEDLTSAYYRAAEEIVFFIIRFKNPAFSAEQEWRLLTFAPQLERLKIKREFRASSLGATPYYIWERLDGKQLPIRHVTVGPSPYSAVSDMALKSLLADNGYPTETHFSTIPIRR